MEKLDNASSSRADLIEKRDKFVEALTGLLAAYGDPNQQLDLLSHGIIRVLRQKITNPSDRWSAARILRVKLDWVLFPPPPLTPPPAPTDIDQQW